MGYDKYELPSDAMIQEKFKNYTPIMLIRKRLTLHKMLTKYQIRHFLQNNQILLFEDVENKLDYHRRYKEHGYLTSRVQEIATSKDLQLMVFNNPEFLQHRGMGLDAIIENFPKILEYKEPKGEEDVDMRVFYSMTRPALYNEQPYCLIGKQCIKFQAYRVPPELPELVTTKVGQVSEHEAKDSSESSHLEKQPQSTLEKNELKMNGDSTPPEPKNITRVIKLRKDITAYGYPKKKRGSFMTFFDAIDNEVERKKRKEFERIKSLDCTSFPDYKPVDKSSESFQASYKEILDLVGYKEYVPQQRDSIMFKRERYLFTKKLFEPRPGDLDFSFGEDKEVNEETNVNTKETKHRKLSNKVDQDENDTNKIETESVTVEPVKPKGKTKTSVKSRMVSENFVRTNLKRRYKAKSTNSVINRSKKFYGKRNY